MAALVTLNNPPSLPAIMALVFVFLLWTALRSWYPLRHFSGPFAAKFTNAWRLLDVWKGRQPFYTHIKLHEKYGCAVRMGPNVVSLSDPELIKTVFQTRNPWTKSEGYSANDVIVNGNRLSTSFGTRDENWHNQVVNPIRGIYKTTGALKYEERMDETLRLFCERMERTFMQTAEEVVKTCPLGQWINYFAWDMMNNMTFSRHLGCIEKGGDVGRMLEASVKTVNYFGIVSQIPQLDYLFDKNLVCRIGPPSLVWGMMYSYKMLAERQAAKADPTGDAEAKVDFLDEFIATKEQNPESTNDNIIVSWLMNNVIAGSDTVSIALCAIIYYTIRNPAVLRRLQDELDSAALTAPAQWKELQNLLYLDAVIKEGMRIHPSVGMMLERVVPGGGFSLPDGRFLPAGTVVGMNPWVTNRYESVFGERPNEFRPERWLKGDDESEHKWQARVMKMKGAELTFGHGNRVCIGKFVALVEIYKTIATVFSKYEIRPSNLGKEWKLNNPFFTLQDGIDVYMAPRQKFQG